MTVLRRHTGAVILAIAGTLALLGQTVSAQSNICYPKANKRSPLKKGACFMVSHTLATSLGLDHPAALDPLDNDFILVDRHSGDPISSACKRTKVYVSTDATDVDLGHFKRQNWATQAMTLVEGKLQVDHEAIEANLPATQNRKADKHSTTTELETIFMVEFECPSSPGASEGKWRTKQPRNSNFRAALRYVPNPGEINAANFYPKFFQHLLDLHGRTVETSIQANNSVSSSSSDVLAAAIPLSDTPPDFGVGNIIHNPTCPAINALDQTVFCDNFAVFQDQTFNFITGLSLPTCPGVYPDYMQGLVDQSKGLGTDKRGNVLPGTLDDMRVDGVLTDQVDWETIKKEKATLFWLFDKTQQLGPWAICDDGTDEVPGEVTYELKDKFAPGFGDTTLYYINNDFEFADSVYFENGFSTGSNFTRTAIAQSSMGLDAAGVRTFVLAFRGTRARSEWISDLQYNQVHVNLQTLDSRPFLRPFLDMAIHEGFAEIFEQVYIDIVTKVLDANPGRVIVTGHSLGGGMASLLAYALARIFENTPVQVDAALFAPPTAGDDNFADAFNRYVNGRRVAYVTYQPDFLTLTPSGDQVPQLMCPDQYVCEYLLKDERFDAPVRTKFPFSGDLRNVVQYKTVGGNVLFDYRHFPDAPADAINNGLPVNIIRDTWLALDDPKFELNAHICSYGCFLSSEVDAPLNKCFMEPNKDNSFLPGGVLPLFVDGRTIADIKQKLPPNVQQYGLC